MPPSYQFLEQETLERRLDDAERRRMQLGLSESEWDQLIADIIEEETGFVTRVLENQGVDFGHYPTQSDLLTVYPEVRRAMVRLCRSSIHETDEDGLQSESVGDHSENYRSSGDIREEVRAELQQIEVEDEGDHQPSIRSEMI